MPALQEIVIYEIQTAVDLQWLTVWSGMNAVSLAKGPVIICTFNALLVMFSRQILLPLQSLQPVRGWHVFHSENILEFFQLQPQTPLVFFGLWPPPSSRDASEYLSPFQQSPTLPCTPSTPTPCLTPPPKAALRLRPLKVTQWPLWTLHPLIQTLLQCSSETLWVIAEIGQPHSIQY